MGFPAQHVNHAGFPMPFRQLCNLEIGSSQTNRHSVGHVVQHTYRARYEPPDQVEKLLATKAQEGDRLAGVDGS